MIASFYEKTIKYTDYFEIVFIFLKNPAETTIGKRSKGGKHYIIKAKNKKILIFNFSIDTLLRCAIIRIVSKFESLLAKEIAREARLTSRF